MRDNRKAALGSQSTLCRFEIERIEKLQFVFMKLL